MLWDSRAASLAVALGVGLLIGLDREKHKSAGTASQSAGVRTFTLVALLGAMAALLPAASMLFGGRPFAIRVCPSHLAMILALWLPGFYVR